MASVGPRKPIRSFATASSPIFACRPRTVSKSTSGALLAAPFSTTPDAPSSNAFIHWWINVEVHLEPRRQLGHRLLALQRDPRPERSRVPLPPRHPIRLLEDQDDLGS